MGRDTTGITSASTFCFHLCSRPGFCLLILRELFRRFWARSHFAFLWQISNCLQRPPAASPVFSSFLFGKRKPPRKRLAHFSLEGFSKPPLCKVVDEIRRDVIWPAAGLPRDVLIDDGTAGYARLIFIYLLSGGTVAVVAPDNGTLTFLLESPPPIVAVERQYPATLFQSFSDSDQALFLTDCCIFENAAHHLTKPSGWLLLGGVLVRCAAPLPSFRVTLSFAM